MYTRDAFLISYVAEFTLDVITNVNYDPSYPPVGEVKSKVIPLFNYVIKQGAMKAYKGVEV
jgi:hypothetical protein